MRVGTDPLWFSGPDPLINSAGARNIAATAIVAAKVYEAYQWVRYHGPVPAGEAEYHVPEAEEIMQVLTDLAVRAMNSDEAERDFHHLRFMAFAAEEGTDRHVEFYLSIGSTWSDRVEVVV